MTKNSPPGLGAGSPFKANKMTILQLQNNMEPHAAIEVYGVWVRSWKTAEFAYGTNDFHSIDVEFRYDFMDYIGNSELT